MSQILVRDLDEGVVERLKRRARADGRSLQSEVKLIIEQAVNKPVVDMEAARKTAEEFRRRFKGRKFPDTSGLIREDPRTVSEYVVDASIAAKWFIEEEHGEAALSVLDGKNQLHAPDFMLLEMDSIICKWIRRGAVNLKEGGEVRDALRLFPLQQHPFIPILDFAYEIAMQTGQSSYDCIYVALAAVLKCRMLTADRRLHDALKDGPFKKHVAWVGDIAPRKIP